jgi:hypothetical protein
VEEERLREAMVQVEALIRTLEPTARDQVRRLAPPGSSVVKLAYAYAVGRDRAEIAKMRHLVSIAGKGEEKRWFQHLEHTIKDRLGSCQDALKLLDGREAARIARSRDAAAAVLATPIAEELFRDEP